VAGPEGLDIYHKIYISETTFLLLTTVSLYPQVEDEYPVSYKTSSRTPDLAVVRKTEAHEQKPKDHSKLKRLVQTLGLSLLEFWIPMSGYKSNKSYFQGSDYGHAATVDDIDLYMNPIELLEHTQHSDMQRLPCYEEPRYFELLKHILYRLPQNIKVQHAMHSNKDCEGRGLDAIGAIPFIADNEVLEDVVVQAVSEHCGKYCPNRMHCYLVTDYVPEFHNPDGTRLDSSVFFG